MPTADTVLILLVTVLCAPICGYLVVRFIHKWGDDKPEGGD